MAQLRSELKGFEEALVSRRLIGLVTKVIIGFITVAGALIALVLNFGKLIGK